MKLNTMTPNGSDGETSPGDVNAPTTAGRMGATRNAIRAAVCRRVRIGLASSLRNGIGSSNDEVERPRDHLWRAADIVEAEKLDIVRLALYASRTARTDC